MKKNEELFKKYESLAVYYAGKVFNQSLLGLDRDDVVQEFRIKLYETILAYERNAIRRKKRGMIRPTPIPYYIKASLNNYVKDFIVKIKDTQELFSEDSFGNTHDYAVYSNNSSEIDTNKNVYVINGFDLIAPLEGLEKTCFTMWLKGTPPAQLQKTFGSYFNAHNVIHKHKQYLKSKKDLFDLENVSEIFQTNHMEMA